MVENRYSPEILPTREIQQERESRLQEQIRLLQEQLRQQEEELHITMARMGSHLSYYDVATRTLRTIPQTAKIFGVPEVMENYPESHIASAPAGYPPESAQQLRSFVDAIRRGEPSGNCDYFTVAADGQQVWLRREFVTIFDQEGRPVRAVIASEDVTERYTQTRRQDLDRLGLIRASETVYPEMVAINITRGHYRIVRHGDLMQGVPAEGPLEEMLRLRASFVAPEDRDAFRKNFFPQPVLEAFERGRDRMQLTYRRIGPDGVTHWMETVAVRQENPYNDDILVFAVTRDVDRQKQQEERLQQALDASIDKFDGWHYYNRLTSRTYTGLTYVDYPDGRPSPYVVGGLAKQLDCPERELVLGTCFRIPEEEREAAKLAIERSREAGEKTFRVDYPVETDRGETVWIHNRATQFVDKSGETGYIHFLTDITHERALLNQLKVHMEERLRESEQIFDIVAKHSNRVLYEYDPSAGSIRPWNQESARRDILAQLYTDVPGEELLGSRRAVLLESLEEAEKFFQDIRSGVPSGEAKLHLKRKDQAMKWYHFHYTSMPGGEAPGVALVSVEDITESHEHEIAYLSHRQAMDENMENYLIYMEACLTCNRVEAFSGKAAERRQLDLTRPYMDQGAELMHSLFLAEDLAEAIEYFSCQSLMELYHQGERSLNSTWGARSHDGVQRWVNVRTSLIADPYNGHIKAFIRAMDITREHEQQTSLVQQAEYDTMTGLLRRGVGETRIREYLSAHASPGGVLAVLDLDDLKGINDTLGHAQGDRAIIGIADTLKRHFRKDDILVRAGGDEFLIFLPGAGEGACAVEQSLLSLQKELSAISLGENAERTVRCSIGCAVELPDTDTFDSLFQRADIALYHVKRSGKNNVAFFEPEMLEESYRLKVKQAIPVVAAGRTESELQKLLEVISVQYPGVVRFELTRDMFRIMSVGGNVTEVHDPDRVDIFWENWRENIHPDDWPDTFSTLCRESLLVAFARGKRRFSHYYRNREERGYVMTEVDVRFYAGANGDIGAFLFFRWDTGEAEA